MRKGATTMLAKTMLFTITLLAGAGLAQGEGGFSNGSIQGLYAFTFTVGANTVAGLGTCRFDGVGQVDCSYRVNATSPAGKRMTGTITNRGSYQVAPEGTVEITLTITYPDRSSDRVALDMVVTDVEPAGATPLALELFAIQREAGDPEDPEGSLVIARYRRLSD